MLDEFLEKYIQNKLKLYYVLRASTAIDVKEILTVVHSSEYNVRSLLDELADDFIGLAHIKKDLQLYSLHVNKGVNLLKLRHIIYKSSNVLQCLKFFIENKSEISYTDYMNEAYISRSDGYRIKKKCQQYLNCIGLDIENNKVVGEEYRIRFLIALLYYKYGIDCCGIDDESIKLARQFIVATNQTINFDFLEKSKNEYGYFECLLILSWKRKAYLPFSKAITEKEWSENHFNQLKKIFVYSDMISYVKRYIEQPLYIQFSEKDYDYIYLAYLCTNSCIFANKWNEEDINLIYQTVFSYPTFCDLMNRMEKKFGKVAVQNRAMKRVMLYFYKKCIFQLQCINPDTSFYFDSVKNPLTIELTCQMIDILDKWREDNHLKYQIDKAHIRHLSIQIEVVLRQIMTPIRVVIVSDMLAELEVMRMILGRRYSSQRIEVDEFLMNARDTQFLCNLENCVIVVHEKFISVMEDFCVSESNSIISVGVEMNSFEMNEIEKAICQHEDNQFWELVRKENMGDYYEHFREE